jgi:hypothetical protein
MTEDEWLACDEPVRLLSHLNRPAGDRKLLLYGVACCRAHEHLLQSDASRNAVDWAERFADGEVQRDDEYDRLDWASEGAAFRCEQSKTREDSPDWMDEVEVALHFRGRITEPERSSVRAAYFANALMTHDTHDPFDPTFSNYASLLLLPFLRDIFGNPFRPVAFAPEWRTDTAVALAKQMYDSREFGAMPILADALQDAGCDNADILSHCRDTSLTHVRGCWVTDLVLGKE